MNNKKKSKAGWITGIVLLTLAALIISVYFYGVDYFRERYLLNTKIGGISCGNQVPQYVISKNQTAAEEYLLTVYFPDGNKVNLVGEDFSCCYVSSGEEEKILAEQNPYQWPLSFFRTSSYDITWKTCYDPEKLKEVVDALDVFQPSEITYSQDAYLKITSDGYEIVPEMQGNELDKEQVEKLIDEAVSNQQSSITLTDDLYIPPSICSDDPSITDLAAKLDTYLNATIHYDIDGEDENVTRKDIAKWIYITDDDEVKIDESKVTTFVQSLATKYNTYGDVRKFKTTAGDTIEIGGGDYGWIIDKTGEKEQILEDLAGGEPVEREPVYEQRAKKSGTDDIGDTYVEVDYTKQHFWFYKSGEMVLDSDFVSGNLSTHNGSVDGVFKIVYKQENATLVGENYSSAVKYFMPFAYNIGFHDASWRSSFGGEIYRTSGSHGCINLPEDVARELYSLIEVGTPVVAYYREKVELTNNAAKVSNAYSYVE